MDLAITACLLVYGAHFLFRIGKRMGVRLPLPSQLLASAAILIALWLAWNSNQSFRWAQWIPHGSVLLIANASVLLLVLAAGLLFGSYEESGRKRQLLCIALCTTAAFFAGMAIWRPVYQPLNFPLADSWDGEVCLQTHASTCAPAAVATLANQFGIHTTEKDMAKACLTSKQGTLALGSYRGTYLVTRNSSYVPQVVICHPSTYPQRWLDNRLPMLAHVCFDDQEMQNATEPMRFSGKPHNAFKSDALHRRLPGQPSWRSSAAGGHVVVILQREPNGNLLVADPAVGKIRWSDKYFRQVWVGEGIYLVSQ